MTKIGAFVLGTLAIFVFTACGNDDPLSSSTATGISSIMVTPAPATPLPPTKSAPPVSIDPTKNYVANLITAKGIISIE